MYSKGNVHQTGLAAYLGITVSGRLSHALTPFHIFCRLSVTSIPVLIIAKSLYICQIYRGTILDLRDPTLKRWLAIVSNEAEN